jgi:hypothetical protein
MEIPIFSITCEYRTGRSGSSYTPAILKSAFLGLLFVATIISNLIDTELTLSLNRSALLQFSFLGILHFRRKAALRESGFSDVFIESYMTQIMHI